MRHCSAGEGSNMLRKRDTRITLAGRAAYRLCFSQVKIRSRVSNRRNEPFPEVARRPKQCPVYRVRRIDRGDREGTIDI